jgi:hypothetical protein
MPAAIAGMSRWRFMLKGLLGLFVPPLKRMAAQPDRHLNRPS